MCDKGMCGRSEDKQRGAWVLSYHGIPGLNSSYGVWQAVTLSHLSCSTMLLVLTKFSGLSENDLLYLIFEANAFIIPTFKEQ